MDRRSSRGPRPDAGNITRDLEAKPVLQVFLQQDLDAYSLL